MIDTGGIVSLSGRIVREGEAGLGLAFSEDYADEELNPLGQKDHFLAFAINDQTLLDTFYSLYGIEYNVGLDDVWLIAFEDLNLGDADYTDLVAVVSCPSQLNSAPIPTPMPGAVWFLGSGILGIAGLRKRKG
ncbi:hypothetical protein DSCW_64290 [Desulfosarcina widdelii]|uniref:Uncharacterized protein n=1 Tax=Desulfosarcina widdelii TaxID=947919 RepID=A0A5K7ZAE8_9BACT|nr:hypothetical protein [Desulfosarcina widdelii]BBO79012.1 hypothetical protein DSCW_64290 [Desulfosarcina widdelii]